MTCFFLCPDWSQPSAGTRTIYRQVSVLNRHGIGAYVLHEKLGFKMTWFKHDVPVRYFSSAGISSAEDILVIPEIYGPQISQIARGVKKVIFNQNAGNTFLGSDPKAFHPGAYLDSEVVAYLCASEDNQKLLEFAFPGKRFHLIRYSVDPSLFYFQKEKQKKIAYMTHKRRDEIQAVAGMLKNRGNLNGFELVPIENKSEKECAQILRDSAIFLSFSAPEGWPLVTFEALSCGCFVTGYMTEEPTKRFRAAAFPVPVGDMRQFVESTELAIQNWEDGLRSSQEISRLALELCSPEKEEARTLEIWQEILGSCFPSKQSTVLPPAFSSKKPMFSVIIPCWNNAELTERCISSVLRHSSGFEVVLADNGSTDRTISLLESFQHRYPEQVQVIRNDRNMGFAHAINQGAQIAKSEFIVLLNNDTEVCEGWLEKLSSKIEENVGAAGACATNGGWWQNTNSNLGGDPELLTFFCCMISRKVWDEVGPLDENFTHGADDLDWCIRARQAGYKLAVAKDCIITHVGGATVSVLAGSKLGSQEYSNFMLRGLKQLREKWGENAVAEYFPSAQLPSMGNQVLLRTVQLD